MGADLDTAYRGPGRRRRRQREDRSPELLQVLVLRYVATTQVLLKCQPFRSPPPSSELSTQVPTVSFSAAVQRATSASRADRVSMDSVLSAAGLQASVAVEAGAQGDGTDLPRTQALRHPAGGRVCFPGAAGRPRACRAAIQEPEPEQGPTCADRAAADGSSAPGTPPCAAPGETAPRLGDRPRRSYDTTA